jgi:hypothetical protein
MAIALPAAEKRVAGYETRAMHTLSGHNPQAVTRNPTKGFLND